MFAVRIQQYFGEIKNDFFSTARPEILILNHFADSARRRLEQKLLSIRPHNIINKNVRCANQELQWFQEKVKMVSTVARI